MFQNIIEVLILSAIQGISEFLPISSSAHLILVSSLYEFKSSSLLIDIGLHLGSLVAIVYYFKEELLNINKNKRLKKLNRFNLNDGKSFALNTDATNLNAEQRSLVATLFSNFGFVGSRVTD